MISHAATKQMIEIYGLSCAEILPFQKGYRNHSIPVRLDDSRIVNLILYKQEHGVPDLINRANTVSNYLANQGFPARTSIDERILRIRTPQGDRFAALYDYLPGSTIAWEAYTQEHIKLLGASMGVMHNLLASSSVVSLPKIHDSCLRQLRAMVQYFASVNVSSALHYKLGLVTTGESLNIMQEVIEDSMHWGDAQPLHMDFVRGNILYQNDLDGNLRVSGVIDFEKTSYGSRLFDVARTLAFLLVDCKHKHPDKVRKYFIRSGYQKRGGAKLVAPRMEFEGKNFSALETLVDFFLLHDFYKFLRHNPYESLPNNDHFIRTRAFLLERQLIR